MANQMTAKTIIAFQGLEGAYSDLACKAVYPTAQTLPCPNFAAAFEAVKNRQANLAMIPVENLIAGRVAEVHYLIPESGLHIIGEHFQRVVHHLLAVDGATLADIKEVRSHPQALAQCRAFLESHKIKPVAVGDTASGAQEVAQLKDKSIGSIASSLAGERYGLTSLKTDIADLAGNTTRFLVFAPEPLLPSDSESCITSILFDLKSVPAALFKALAGFATCGINLTRIESYAKGGNFTASRFFIDVEGHPNDPRLRQALDELRFYARDVRLLGTYLAHPYRRQTSA